MAYRPLARMLRSVRTKRRERRQKVRIQIQMACGGEMKAIELNPVAAGREDGRRLGRIPASSRYAVRGEFCQSKEGTPGRTATSVDSAVWG